jgi:ABC-type Fe3+-citrate transport system substrate-binding protein
MSRDQYKKAIEQAINDKLLSKEKPFRYKKNDTEMYALLNKKGNQASAINRARELADSIDGEQFANYNPQTMVFKLVEELNGQSTELNAEIMQKYENGK